MPPRHPYLRSPAMLPPRRLHSAPFPCRPQPPTRRPLVPAAAAGPTALLVNGRRLIPCPVTKGSRVPSRYLYLRPPALLPPRQPPFRSEPRLGVLVP